MATTKAFITLLEKNGRDDLRTIANISPVPFTENNLADWFVRLEIINTGVSKTNSGTLTLRVDDLGTFIRTGPILVNEATKNTYLIEMQLKQDLDNDDDFNDPTEQGIVLRAIIGQPQISIDQTFGEILRINLVGIEYNIKESVTSTWHLFQNPNESFQNRIDEINLPNGSIRHQGSVNNLPTSPKLSFKPSEPTKIHDTMSEIIDILSNPAVTGGSFDDYYFDVEPDTNNTNYIKITADKFGDIDSGVIIDPLSIDTPDTDEEQTVVTDNIEYKNHVVMIGTTDGGSLPVERTRFASGFEHARIRDSWSDAGVNYIIGDLVQFKTTTSLKPHLVTYHRALSDHTSSGGNDPLTTSGTLWEQDFTTYPNFITTSGAFYKAGEIVTLTSGGTVNMYQAKVDGVLTTPLSNPTQWDFIVGFLESTYTAFISYSPWTNDVDLWKETLAGRGFQPAGTEGWAFDWNITKANYSREDLTSHFEPITPKVVNGIKTAQPATIAIEHYDTQRYLLTATPTGADWAGNGNRVAELDGKGVTGEWIFSIAPSNTDTVNDLEIGQVFQYNSGSGLFGSIWDGGDQNDTDKPSPFHLCSNVGLVAGATGISGQAVEFTYNWNVVSADLANTHYFRTSRGAWISNSFPLPRIDTTNFKTGELFGGQGGTTAPSKGTLDTNNFDTNHKGLAGWNHGLDDEDYGKLLSLVFKMRVGMFKDVAGTILVEGQPEVPMIFWAADKFDRVWFTKFKLRRIGQWDDVKIPVGDLAQNQLYFARWDELAKLINGVTLTELDFTLVEKEFSGVAFDWREVKHWGVQLAESYVETGLYKNGLQRAVNAGEDVISDYAANFFWQMIGPIAGPIRSSLPDHLPITQNHKRFSAKIAIDDLHFEKEQLATSDNTSITNPRTIVEFASTESDYLNLKDRAVAKQARKRFFPQISHIRSVGDVRLRFGEAFRMIGSRVPEQASNNPAWSIITNYNEGDKVSSLGYVYQARRDNLAQFPDNNPDDWDNLNRHVVSEVKHIFDHDGYHTEIAAFRKFTVSG